MKVDLKTLAIGAGVTASIVAGSVLVSRQSARPEPTVEPTDIPIGAGEEIDLNKDQFNYGSEYFQVINSLNKKVLKNNDINLENVPGDNLIQQLDSALK